MPFMNITPLRPEHVEPLARALYLQWHDFAPWSSMDKIRAYYAECLNGENLPLAFAAVGKDGALLGSAALKRHDMEEFPQYEYWLGDVFVLPEHRGTDNPVECDAHFVTQGSSENPIFDFQTTFLFTHMGTVYHCNVL